MSTTTSPVQGHLGQALNFTGSQSNRVQADGAASQIQIGDLTWALWFKSPVKLDNTSAQQNVMDLCDDASGNDARFALATQGSNGGGTNLHMFFIILKPSARKVILNLGRRT